MKRRLTELQAALQRSDLVLLLSLFGIASCIWLFVVLGSLVTGRSKLQTDQRIMLALRESGDLSKPVGPRWLHGGMRDITALGSPAVLVMVVLASAGWLWVRKQHHAFALLLVATLGARFLNAFLKDFFARPRPDLAMHLAPVSSLSFPSGHAMDSTAIYITIAAIVAQLVEPRVQRLYLLALATGLSVLIGLSRVYLGVHYPSDVLAGWCAGLAWALLCWTVARYLQKRGAVEPAK